MAVLDAQKHHQDLVDELIGAVEAYFPAVDKDLLARAFHYAAAAHEGQLRSSGEPFLHHPWATAKILAGLHLDATTIAAGLLHDILEDTKVDDEELRIEFGENIASVVQGVSKIGDIKFKSPEEHQAENWRKMLLSIAQDVRVILIKLADRLHNMRTIHFLPEEKRLRISQETLDIYAPLAHRFGIATIRWELEDLAFKTLEPEAYDELVMKVAIKREARQAYLDQLVGPLQAALAAQGIPAEVTGRAKHFYSIHRKMRTRQKQFEEIYDLLAVRVIVPTANACYEALGTIHSLWTPIPDRIKDFIASPKSNHYRSLHTTVVGPGREWVEIQIRTPDMHAEAEYGIAAHWLYKRGKGKADEEWLSWVKSLLDWQQDEADPREFMKTFRTDLFDDEVYVFTPKGEVKTLPTGSTPIDFAYAVHTDVGHKTVGAKINGRIVPLHYRLKNGDFVEILTSKSGRGPSRDWMSLAASSRARNKIRQWFQRETRGETEAKGREILDAALKAQNLPYRKLQGSAVLAQVIRETGFKKAEDFYVALGSGKLQSGQIVNKVLQRLKTDEVAEEPMVPRRRPRRARRWPATRSGSRCRGSRTCWCGWRSAARRCPATRSSATSRSAVGSRSTARTAPTCGR